MASRDRMRPSRIGADIGLAFRLMWPLSMEQFAWHNIELVQGKAETIGSDYEESWKPPSATVELRDFDIAIRNIHVGLLCVLSYLPLPYFASSYTY